MPQKTIPDDIKKRVDQIVEKFNLEVIKDSNTTYITRYEGEYLLFDQTCLRTN